jgi:hypothetical protein
MAAHPLSDDWPQMSSWNGGVTRQQLEWLRGELRAAEAAGQRVVVASHHQLGEGAARATHMAWNWREVQQVGAAVQLAAGLQRMQACPLRHCRYHKPAKAAACHAGSLNLPALPAPCCLQVLLGSPAFRLALAGHDHLGGYAQIDGRHFVTLEALLEAPDNAYAVVHAFPDRLQIVGSGSVTSRGLAV